MSAQNYLPLALKAEAQSPNDCLDVSASKSADGKRLVLKVVNVSNTPVPAQISVGGFHPRKAQARFTVLAGDWEAVNTVEQPHRIKPLEGVWQHGLKNGACGYEFPARSFTVLRFE